MTVKYFGTDGIRGPVGGEVVNPLFAGRLGAAVGNWVKKSGRKRPLILIGRDTRPSGSDLVTGFASGFSSVNIETHSLGILPTPALALAVRSGTACLGVMVTASHNPVSDNGFKLFDHHGHKLTIEDEAIVESLLPESAPRSVVTLTERSDSLAPYLEHLATILPEGSLKNWPIALDTANGATARASRMALDRLGAKVEQIGEGAANQLINDNVGTECPESLARLTRETNSRLGIAHDGDGDRVVFCDEKGQLVEGSCTLGIFALDARKRGLDGSSILVTTDYANYGLDHSLSEEGITVERTEVGDRF
ncbi:MAG: phosphoglucosamine mutase, partial [Opitutales bacterium]